MVVMHRAAMVQLTALMMAVRHVFVVVAISFPSVTGLLNIMDDLEGVLMMIIMFVVVMGEVRVVIVVHPTIRRCSKRHSFRDDSAEHRMMVTEGTMREWAAMSM